MNHNLLPANVRLEHTVVNVDDVFVGVRQRDLIESHVEKVLDSFQTLGGRLQLQPILVTDEMVLIDGGHRLEAAKRAGWEHLAAYIVYGIDEDDRALLEAIANVTRQELNPVQLAETWRDVLEPRYRKAGKLRQAAGGTKALVDRGVTASSTDSVELAEPAERTSLPALAKQDLGIDLSTLNKINDVHAIAQSEDVADELREAAQNGLKRIAATGKVEPVWNQIIKMRERKKQAAEDPAVVRARELEAGVDSLMNQITIFSDRLSRQDEWELLREAAATSTVNLESLQAAKYAAARVLVKLVSVVAYGREVTPGREYVDTLDFIESDTDAAGWSK